MFLKIGTGKSEGIHRPWNKSEDRALRDMIHEANKNGDCIISADREYYRPREWVAEEHADKRKYFGKEYSRAVQILYKMHQMEKAYAERTAKHNGEEQITLKL